MKKTVETFLALAVVITICTSCTRREDAVFDAIWRGDIEYVEKAVRGGIPAGSRGKSGAISFAHGAAMHGQNSILKILLDLGAKLEDRDDTGATVLTYAAIIGNNEMLLDLLARGANINHQDMFGATPLYHAMRKGNYDTVRILLDAGAMADVPIKSDKLPIDMADEDTPTEIIELLEQAMAGAGSASRPIGRDGLGQEAVD